jgi:hypothetical protein
VQRLEDDVREIKADLKSALVDLAYLRVTAESSPTKIQSIGFAIAVFVADGMTRYFGH